MFLCVCVCVCVCVCNIIYAHHMQVVIALLAVVICLLSLHLERRCLVNERVCPCMRVLHLESNDLFPLLFGFVSVVFVVHYEFRASVRQRGDVWKEEEEVVVVYASEN